MSTAAPLIKPIYSLPVCPARQGGNPNKLASFFQMLRFHAHHFVAASSIMGQMIMDLQSKFPQGESARAMDDNLKMLGTYCSELGLSLSAQQAARLNTRDLCLRAIETQSSKPLDQLKQGLVELQQRIWDEMEARMYFQLRADMANYYENGKPPFGQSVFDNFPSAIDDVTEAGNCLALGRNTATVFHLMRVMEVGLKVLGNELEIPYAPSWESYLRQISSKVEGDWKSKPRELQLKQGIYKELAGDLQTVKIAWRNPTMHIVKKYSSSESEAIYSAVKQLMNRMAEAGLKEYE